MARDAGAMSRNQRMRTARVTKVARQPETVTPLGDGERSRATAEALVNSMSGVRSPSNRLQQGESVHIV
jgi:hypothetical protein